MPNPVVGEAIRYEVMVGPNGEEESEGGAEGLIARCADEETEENEAPGEDE